MASARLSQSSFTSGLSMSVTNRWAGMIEQSLYKKTRNSLFQLNSYIYQESPSMFLLHHIIAVFRLLQFIGPSFLVPFSKLWVSGSIDERVINLIAVFFHIFPTSIRGSCTIIYISCYIVLLALFFIFTLSAAFYYKRNAQLANWVPVTLYTLLNTFGYLTHPIAFELAGECIGLLITKTNQNSTAVDSILVALTFVCFGGYLWLMSTVASTSILFNPSSLPTVLGRPQMLFIYSTNIVTFVLAIASKLTNDTAVYILIGIGAIIYLLSAFIPFVDGGFIRFVDACFVICLSLSGFIFCVGGICLMALKTTANMIVIFAIAAIICIMYFVSYFIMRGRKEKALDILDQIDGDKENFALVKSPRHFCEIVVHGFQMAFPVCTSWEIFQRGVERWQTNVLVWCMYTKFAAIYPEETQVLGWIQHQMMSLHLKGSTSKHIQEEIINLIRTRESNISPELKKKLNRIGKKVQSVKHKLRHIWDLIIQGNIGDLGTFVDKAYSAIQDAEAEYNHILRQYPNSRFVSRSYARFLIEVLADHERFQIWAEKAKMLHRGVSVVNDRAHVLGLTYFPSLPNVMDKMGEPSATNNIIDSESNLIDAEDTDEKWQQNVEQTISLKRQINDLVIPGIHNAKIHRIVVPLVLFLAILIAVTVVIFVLEKRYSEPLTYLHHISLLRTYVFLTASYGLQYIHETMKLAPARKDVFPHSLEETPPEYLYETWDMSLQFSFLLNELVNSVQSLSGLRAIAVENADMDSAREHIFGNSVNYSQFASGKQEWSVTSAQVGVMDISMQLSNLFNSNIDATIFSSSMIVNPTYNANNVADSVSLSLDYINRYMSDNNSRIINLFYYLRIAFLIVYPIVFIVLIIIELKQISQNRFIIFKCLTTLPKNVVSSVADSLKIMKNDHSDVSTTKGDVDSELNKQEENMLKIFATASDSSSSKLNNSVIMLICTVCSIALSVFFILQLHDLFCNMSTAVYDAAPHINNLMGAYAYQASMIMMLKIVATENENYDVVGSSTEDILEKLPTVLSSALSYFHNARFGKEDQSEQPFKEFNDGILRQNELNGCESTMDVPTTSRDAYKCISLELLFYVVEPLIDTLVEPLSQSSEKFNVGHSLMSNLWEIGTTFMYNRFFYPIFATIIENVENSLTSDIESTLVILYVLFLLEVLVELCFIYNLCYQEQRLRFSLRLLMHCNMSSFMQIPLITNVLSGNFSSQKGDTAQRNKEFFDEVLNLLPDSLLIVDETGTISSINEQAKRTFSTLALLGTKITDFFNLDVFENSVNTILNQQPPQEEQITYFDKATNSRFNLDVRSLEFNQTTAYTMRDITQTVRYNTLIEEERLKSDKLLESILPAKLVKRVQQGEKNISFAVQSASVVFMDIVSFTPWCGSLPASRVVEILNILYKEFDALASKYPTVTKIKCIGDCYMAASGIFAEINQPAVHAKELTQFGIDAINAVTKVNGETEQSLQIRVGINTGGPVVAGVLGSGKPTFEILGPVINMAQQMEHTGVPMNVHISRGVYELIYGGDFKIKERGQIEVKHGTVMTYLVFP